MGNATQPKGFKQIIYSEPLWVCNGESFTKKGQWLWDKLALLEAQGKPTDMWPTRDEIFKKYMKPRYVKNPNAKVVKVIYHPKLDKFGKLVSYHG